MSTQKHHIYHEPIASEQDAFSVYMDEKLIAEVRTENTDDLAIIPMRSLSDKEREVFYNYIEELFSKE